MKPSYADDIYNPITSIEDLYQGNVNDEEYDLLVFIGRFQPFHLGHRRVIDIALRKAKKVLVLVGSAFRPRRPRNPWTWIERRDMIQAAMQPLANGKLIIKPLEDYTYRDELWTVAVQDAVNETINEVYKVKQNRKIGLIGCSKDNSSYYLKLFPQYGNVNVRFLNPLNATQIRENFFLRGIHSTFYREGGKLSGATVMDSQVTNWLDHFRFIDPKEVSKGPTEAYEQVRDYMEACKTNYAARQKGQQYPVQDVAADALVVQSGHILMVERKGAIGKGLLAMPGGYVEENETFLDAALRELREETTLKVPVPVLKGSMKATFLADDPYRSERGRMISQVHLFRLTDQLNLPDVRGGDDANKAFWMPISDVSPENCFEDHYDVICKMLGL